MLNFMLGMAHTGDNSRPWLFAICMIASIVMVIGIFIISQKSENDDEDVED